MTNAPPLKYAPARLLLLRHGRTEWNHTGRFQGQLDPPLDATGRAQAAAAGAVIAPMRPDVIVCSDLSRALETARPVAAAAGLDLVVDARLRELYLGAWEGLTRPEARERFPEEYAAWQAGADAGRGDGETYADAGRRAVECLLEHVAALGPSPLVVAVTHGGTARATVGTLIEMHPDTWWRLTSLGNTRWSLLSRIRRGWRLDEHNAGQPFEEQTGDDAR